MPESQKLNNEEEVAGSYYYDDATGYQRYDPDAANEDEDEETVCDSATAETESEVDESKRG